MQNPHALRAIIFALALPLLLACSAATSALPPLSPKPLWVAAWADSPSAAAGPSGAEQTFREIVKPTVGSRGTVRLHFSNYFGTASVTLGAVHIGRQTAAAGVTNDVAITFSGVGAVTIPAGTTVTSDNLALHFSYGDLLSVTEYVRGSWSTLTAHAQGVDAVTSYATAPNAGNMTQDAAGTAFTHTTFNTYLLDRVEVYGDYKETIAAFGSSTTDGYRSGLDLHMTYPEQLAAALHAAGQDDIAIANVGIAGTTVFGATPTAGLNRFLRDVPGLPNVTAVIDYLGANDLRGKCVTAAALIAGKQALIAQAHTAKLRIYEATIAPSTFCGAQHPGSFGTRFAQDAGEESERALLNTWLHSTKPSTVNGVPIQPPGADALIDFNAAIVDPANKSYMLPTLNSGDDIHPNASGYGAMVQAIPLTLF